METVKAPGKIEAAVAILGRSRRTVALTGAGISTPSGIPDFRSPRTGLWENVNVYEVASLDGFRRRPESYYQWVRPLARLIRDARPNAAHLALAEMEARGRLRAVITQNIDGLHQAAGSRDVLELHGSHREMVCIACGRTVESSGHMDRFLETGDLPRCDCGGVLKVSTVLFGESLPPDTIRRADREARACEAMIVAGTSLEVTPACDLPLVAAAHGAALVIVNLRPTRLDPQADVVLHEDVAAVLPALTAALNEESV